MMTTLAERLARPYEPLAPSRLCLAALGCAQLFLNPLVAGVENVGGGLRRRWRRERRRRLVGRSDDMALEVARVLPRRARVLDVGCGSGFIAHHLSAILGTSVTGLDVRRRTDAPIDYHCFVGARLPVAEGSYDAVLLCYVLHHAQDQRGFLREVRRALRPGGLAVVYEDIPGGGWDRAVCGVHERQWRARTGPCTFRLPEGWRDLFAAAGFEPVAERPLSRWRNLAHPVSRRLFVLKAIERKP